MKKYVKAWLVSSLVSAALLGATAPALAAEPRTPYPQMMQGQWGGGPGMMGGGYGPGYGMHGGGYGPGMMGGGMGGYGPGFGMGPGMMGAWGVGMGPLYMLDLTDAQTAQMEKIQTEMMSRHRTLARQMWDEQEKLGDMYGSDKRDPDKIGKTYGKISELQRQMIEMHAEAENKMQALLTKEQKEQLRRGYGRGMMGY
ncbi:MAG: Spy/CpxP family protein refolding chaperone [Gallionellaceae bacterium]